MNVFYFPGILIQEHLFISVSAVPEIIFQEIYFLNLEAMAYHLTPI